MTIENFKDLTNRVAAIQSYLKIDEKNDKIYKIDYSACYNLYSSKASNI